MKSVVEITNKVGEVDNQLTSIGTGDILLIRVKQEYSKDSRECLVRVHTAVEDTGYCLAVLGNTTIYTILSKDNNEAYELYVGREYVTRRGTVIEILGICSVEIIVNDIRR